MTSPTRQPRPVGSTRPTCSRPPRTRAIRAPSRETLSALSGPAPGGVEHRHALRRAVVVAGRRARARRPAAGPVCSTHSPCSPGPHDRRVRPGRAQQRLAERVRAAGRCGPRRPRPLARVRTASCAPASDSAAASTGRSPVGHGARRQVAVEAAQLPVLQVQQRCLAGPAGRVVLRPVAAVLHRVLVRRRAARPRRAAARPSRRGRASTPAARPAAAGRGRRAPRPAADRSTVTTPAATSTSAVVPGGAALTARPVRGAGSGRTAARRRAPAPADRDTGRKTRSGTSRPLGEPSASLAGSARRTG